MTPIGEVAVDQTWCALRLRPLKPVEAPFKVRLGRART
jgi:hypothetical protein